MADSIPYLAPFQFQESIFPPITRPKIPAQEESHHRAHLPCVGILEQSMYGARNLVGTALSFRPSRLHRLAESIPWINSGAP